MPGNHDGSLGPFFVNELGARFVPEPLRSKLKGSASCFATVICSEATPSGNEGWRAEPS